MKAPRVVLATFGSYGDLHPFIAVALRLRDEGFDPLIAAAAEYREKVASEGIGFHPLRPDHGKVEQELGMSRTEVVRAVSRRPDFLLRRMILPYLRQSYADAMAATADADLVVTHMAAYGAKLAAEKRRLPHLGVALMPMIFMSRTDPPAAEAVPLAARWLYRLGAPARNAVLAASKTVFRRWARPIDELRAEVGLPPASRHPLFEGQFSREGALGLYSPLLGEEQPDYPRNTTLTGFAFYDSEAGGPAAIDSALERFLAAGAPPLAFTLGTSAVNDAGLFVRAAIDVAAALRQRAVLLLDEERQREWQHCASDRVFVCRYAPYSLLFPRAQVIVHHGGVGTTAQALRAGRPQLITPYLVDQPDNAARMVRLGVARAVFRHRDLAHRMRSELESLLRNPHYLARAQQVASAIAREDGAGCAVAVIRAVLARSRTERVGLPS